MSLYAYCLSDEVTDGAVESVVGIAASRPRLLRRGEIVTVVSECEAEAVTVSRENVLAHERVVRRVLVETTPLPFRFGTVVSEAQLQSYVDSQRDSLMVQLERVRGCVEMSVKVIWNLEAMKQEAGEREETSNAGGPALQGSGTAFLNAKRREILGDETLKRRAAEVSSWLSECLKDVVREAQVNVQPKETLVLAAAHLVERERLKEYRAALRRAQKLRGELHFLTSGAWPPYSFTSISS
jgi:hypothetical protein